MHIYEVKTKPRIIDRDERPKSRKIAEKCRITSAKLHLAKITTSLSLLDVPTSFAKETVNPAGFELSIDANGPSVQRYDNSSGLYRASKCGFSMGSVRYGLEYSRFDVVEVCRCVSLDLPFEVVRLVIPI